jgi:hypothetical protein
MLTAPQCWCAAASAVRPGTGPLASRQAHGRRGSSFVIVSAPKNLEVKVKRLAIANRWSAIRPRLPPSSASPSPPSQQGWAPKFRLRRVFQPIMLAIRAVIQWWRGARNHTTPISKNFGGSRRPKKEASFAGAADAVSGEDSEADGGDDDSGGDGDKFLWTIPCSRRRCAD